ncbi:MAG: restriction endonuclease subunit S [Flavobacteriales bacterium]|nr:restriction endonuclease subunit S [Flavobacteriales bacterium]
MLYLLRSPTYRRLFTGGSVQTNISNINQETLGNIEVHLPKISDQQKIAKVLSDLDAKIELNNKINAELEAMAKLIYDYWFVQFDFPDANGKPYKSSGGAMVYNAELKREIPKGWEVKTIESLLAKNNRTKKIKSTEYQEKGKYPVIDQSMSFICGYTDDAEALIKTEVPRIIFGDHTRIVKLINFDFARGADGTQVLLSNDERIPQHLFYQSIKLIDLSNYGYARHFKFLKEQLVIVPEHAISQKYENIAKSFFDDVKHNTKQNQHLSSLRDWLLPMLMNGQVRVGA